MEQINPFLQQLPDMLGIFILMCVSFLLGYFASYWLQRSKKRKLIERLKKEINAAKQEKVNNIETIFTEIKPKILEVIQEEKKETLSPEAVAERTRNNLVNYTIALGLLRGHYKISLHILSNFLRILPRMLGQNVIRYLTHS